jgi:TolB protein
MMIKKKLLWIVVALCAILGCNLGRTGPFTSPDLFATLQASTPDGSSPFLTESVNPPSGDAITQIPAPTSNPDSPISAIPIPSPADQLMGHIVFTCQLFKAQYANQICIMNADGSGFRRLTWQDNLQNFYPSFSPDGRNVLYAGFREENVYEIYNVNVSDGTENRLTNRVGILTSPEFSPDGQKIVFTRNNPRTNEFQIMIMDANGDNVGNIPQVQGWDTTWSPDGKKILFASGQDGLTQLFTINLNGKGLARVTNLPAIRGRSDWSPDGQLIVTYSGEAWHREIFIMNADGSNVRQLTPTGGNSQGPAFSPDGKWVAFTAYFDHPGEDHGCEIYVIRIDGSDLRRLTNNDYCDYQPRWGP